MAQQRAKWSSRYEKGLVDILTEYRFSHYRDKEGRFKIDYKAIKSILSRSGVSWKNDVSMINTTAAIWEEILEDDSRFTKYENKSFPLFDALNRLYEGQSAEGKHCFTSSKPQKSRGIGIEGEITDKVTLDFTRKHPWSKAIEVGACHGDGSDSPTRYDEQQLLEKEHPQYRGRQNKRSRQRIASGGKGLNIEHTQEQQYEPGYVSDKDEINELQQSDDQATSRSVAVGSNRGRPRKSDVAKPVARIEETMSEFLALKEEQSIVKMHSKMTEDKHSMTRCLAVLQDIDDVSDEIKIHASDVFKDALNREIFLGYEPRLRALWLKKEVNKLGIDMTTN
ncbi:hypothetical protein QOZ80_3BG0273650 [Eleusine coracana subsp. coracana]|nr:hypothetical protein QOZ80_3BG0273650 [Eleusine coracana subsp. coracana]